ncbi:transcriptional regulator, partial [Nocardioides sp.]
MTTLAAARAALDGGDYRGALDRLAGLEESADLLEVRAAAAYGAGEFECAVSSWERLCALHAAAGNDEDAAWAAARVALNLLCETGLMAPVRGWV